MALEDPVRIHMVQSAALVAVIMLATGSAPSARKDVSQATRQIPGLTAKDEFPDGCVGCHIVAKDGDMRIGAMAEKWKTAVPAPLLAKAKASSSDASKVKGKHPSIPNVQANTPQTCLAACHKRGSTIAPPFAQLMHAIHLTGGAQNKFLTMFQGECTHCHKMDQKTGTWKIASGAEK